MISVKNLTKTYKTTVKAQGIKGFVQYLFNRQYKEIEAVKNISFEIAPHELVGFIGPNGAGKTTTIKMLSGLLYPTAGSVKVAGFLPQERKKEFLKSISFLMGQKNQLFWELPAYDTFTANRDIYEIGRDKFKRQLNFLIDLLDVSKIVTQPVKTLSLGERMKMELIASLIYEPKVLFLDEPTIGLDIISQKAIRDFIKQYNEEKKATVILTSHYLKDVVYLADRLIMINKGKLVYDGDVETIKHRYSKEKLIKLVLRNRADVNDLKQIVPNFKYNYPVVTFRVPRENLADKISKITETIDFIDIDISEISIEEIISSLWQKEGKE